MPNIDVEKLKKYLEENGIKDSQIVEATEYSITSTAQFLNGYKYSEMFFRRLCEFLDISYSEFVDKFARE